MKKGLILSMCLLLVLTWCTRPGWDSTTWDSWAGQEQEASKTIYYVETASVSSLSEDPSLRKTGKLTGKSDVMVSSQSSGRVSSIRFEEGDKPGKWSRVISLADSNNLYNFSASRWRESVEAARINYDSTKINLDNSIVDLELALQRAQQQYDIAIRDAEQVRKDNEQQLLDLAQQIKDSEQQRILAEYSARTNNPDDPSGSANLSLQKFDSDIEKAEFDLETKLAADQQTLEWFVNSVEVLQDTIVNIFETTLDGVDKIVWVSNINKTNNDAYEQFLGAQDTQTLFRAENSLRLALAYQFQLANFPLNVENIDQMPWYLRELDSSLDILDDVLVDVERLLGKTITGNLFPQSQLDALKAQVDGYQAQVVGQAWSVVSQINAIDGFLATYEQNQSSLAKSIEILKEQRTVTEQQLRDAATNADIAANRAEIWSERVDIWLARTKIGLDRALIQAQNVVDTASLNLKSAQNALDANRRTRNITILWLQNSIDQAQVGYSEALANSSKLSVTAPIAWSIGEIFVDEGEEVNPGTPLFSMTSTEDQEVIVTLSAAEKEQVPEGATVRVVQDDEEYVWKIESISDIADDQLLYKTTIKLDELSSRLWDVVSVYIPLESAKTLIPLNIVSMKTSKLWSVWVRNGQEPEEVDVTLGQVRWNAIELEESLGNWLDLITSPMNNFDPNVHDAVEKESKKEKKDIVEEVNEEEKEKADLIP